MEYQTEGKVVVITGAGRGIGRSLTYGFLEHGANVVAIDRSWAPSGFSNDRDDGFLSYLKSKPDNVLLATADVTSEEEVESAFGEAIGKFGDVDVLVNNAAMRQRELFPPTGRVKTLETTDEDWRRSFEVNLFGALMVTRKFIRPMIDKQTGSIMSVISSGATHHSQGGAYEALRPWSREMPYQSTKSALLTLMFYLAEEEKENNVAVNILIPAHTRSTGFDEQNAARRLSDPTERGPDAYRPDHMVPLALHLAGHDASSGITGKAFDVMTWNIEHGLGNRGKWADADAERGIQDALTG